MCEKEGIYAAPPTECFGEEAKEEGCVQSFDAWLDDCSHCLNKKSNESLYMNASCQQTYDDIMKAHVDQNVNIAIPKRCPLYGKRGWPFASEIDMIKTGADLDITKAVAITALVGFVVAYTACKLLNRGKKNGDDKF